MTLWTFFRVVTIFILTLSSCYTLPIRYHTRRTERGNKLIMILLDGFRWDYFHIEGLKGFQRLMKQGVKTEYMTPDFPTESYPNHYSITTGLHVESHGMVGNYMYDPATNDSFRMGYGPNDTHPKWWNAGEPIWVTGKKHRKTSYMYHWLGCDVVIRGMRPDFFLAYGDGKKSVVGNFKSMIDRGIKNIRDDDADIVGIYVEDPDHFGHRYGPFSKVLNNTILKIDKHIDYLLDQLVEHELTQEVNVMIMSDHGMTQMNPQKVINLTNYISRGDWDKLVDGYKTKWTVEYPMFNIWPKEGKEDEVFKLLSQKNPHMHAYTKDSMPVRWHYKDNPRISPILATDDLGWFMTVENIQRRSKYKVFNDTGPLQGGHAFGYKEKDMQAMFVATGPDFKRGKVDLPRIDIVDLYQMMCRVLRIPPAPHNGTWSRAEDYIHVAYGVHTSLGIFLLIGCIGIMMV